MMKGPAPSQAAPVGARTASRLRLLTSALLAAIVVGGLLMLVVPLDHAAGVTAWLGGLRDTPWAAPAAIAGFVVLASVGAPQVLIITALVAAFGPWTGFLYSWIGKVLSCAIGFAAGRRFGVGLVQRRASEDVSRLLDELARHGFWASALIRMAPTAPSVVVNVAAGSTPIRFRDFIAGTALGSVPKMGLIAFASHSAIMGLEGAGLHAWLSLAGALALMILVAVIARRWVNSKLRAKTGAREASPSGD